MPIRIATWNIGWFGQLLKGYSRTIPKKSKPVKGAAKVLQQLQREKIAEEIQRVDPDVLCIQEGPSTGNVERLEEFCEKDLDGKWTVIKRPAGEPWHIKGSQGIFFLVRTIRLAAWQPKLLSSNAWFEATEYESRVDINVENSGEHNKKWPIVHPLFKPKDGTVETLDEPTIGDEGEGETAAVLNDGEHSHYRHPQVLLLTIGDKRVDIIGCHFKSKFGGDDYKGAAAARVKPRITKADRELIQSVEQTAVESRIKLTTEVTNVRYYVDHRFRNEPDPAIFVCGDFNDGVGKEVFERKYLFHDAVANIQGDVIFATRYLNHALFDYSQDGAENHRWTARFVDAWDPYRKPEILLDHIMFSQSVTGNDALNKTGLRVLPQAGKVEHAIHTAVNAVFSGEEEHTSDHRPVTVDVTLSTDVT